ncbi:cache domain-containing sensor histidine kinase [Oceanobacillus oncorhynchi]|uniref:cache domain-containing sensor histidine kinase n=1 Tax=Oceanobacillus oncorhynchi TaxID=545501 RepID=UPI002116DCF2|nr:sensor histidine kinase [Oceanobacillus oncorhynchi]UUI39821.1 histidine kinase [Oceanobacillus oncorhynchi]
MFLSLRNKLFLVFSCVLTIPFLILSLIMPNLFTNYIKEQTQELTIGMMDQFSLYIDSVTIQVADVGQQVLANSITQDWLRVKNSSNNDDETLETARLMVKSELNDMLSSMMVNNSNNISVSIFTHDGEGIWGNYPQLDETEWYQDFMENNKTFTHSHFDTNQQSALIREMPINSHLIPLVDLNTLQDSGIIKVNFSTEMIENSLEKIKIGEHGHTFIIDHQGENVLTGEIQTPQAIIDKSLKQITNMTGSQGLLEIEDEQETYLMFYQQLSVGDWILISEVTEDDLFSHSNQLQKSLLLLSIGLFLITIIASFLFSSSITDPLRGLMKAMRYLEKGDFNNAQKVMPTIRSENNEIRYLLQVFDQMVNRLKQLIDSEYKTNIRRRNAEYKALLLQINPHFLNNTLEIIGGLAAQGKNKEVVNVSVYLGKMLRYALNTESDLVTMAEEIQYIRNYAEILKLRYGGDLQITIEEDQQTKEFPIIKFIIQPLVENAVKYSLISKNHANVEIRAKYQDNQLTLQIADDGVGISDEMIQSLSISNQAETLESSGNSIGLKNVLDRLHLYYGDQFNYHIESELNKGTIITLQIAEERKAKNEKRLDR